MPPPPPPPPIYSSQADQAQNILAFGVIGSKVHSVLLRVTEQESGDWEAKRASRVTQVFWVAAVIIQCLYVVQGRNISVRDTSSKGHIVQKTRKGLIVAGTYEPEKNGAIFDASL